MKNKKPNLLRSAGIGLAILFALITYAYGFQVTKVNLAETKSPRRQEQLVRILRALAKPDLFSYDHTESEVLTQVMVPCPEGGFTPAEPEDKTKPYLVVTPSCADPRTKVTVEGFNFTPYLSGPLNFIPADSDVRLQIATIETDKDGHFSVEARLPSRPSDKVQTIQAITRQKVGSPHWTQTAKDTWDKIIETVFLALLATTLGTAIAIPLSFFAARNLMKDVTSTLTGVSLSILLIPLGFYLGVMVARWASDISGMLTGNVFLLFGSILLTALLIWQGLRWALPQEETETPPASILAARVVVELIAAFLGIVLLYLIAYIAFHGGEYLAEHLGKFGFLGSFIRDLGDILNMVIGAVTALAGAGVLSSFAGRWGVTLNRKSKIVNQIVQPILSAAAGAMLFFLIAAALNWFYQFRNYQAVHLYASLIGAAAGLILALTLKNKDNIPTGMVIYYTSRTIFNGLRSIEPLVMAIVFVVWVGIGPFAGSLALALHTIASLSKLYSEQVESIMAGPIEAIQSTGANRLQTIVYGVIPQIVPPYISFTMYRWDINVRMSTIIGFAGGGGIGFLLQQNINLLNYRAASAQMLAIAIVVASMDYISSKIREKVV